MPETSVIQPDLEFKSQILGRGAHDLTACYQCGTCSIVCPISTPENPFPRKEMVWVQWGLKDLALSNSSIWACHDCAICTSYCPREAQPAQVMAALREYSIEHYAVPRVMGRMLGESKFLPLLFAIPALIFGAILAGIGNLAALPEGTVVFSKFMPIVFIEVVFTAAMALSLTAAATGGLRYWRAMNRGMIGDRGPVRLLATLRTILRHRKFRQCADESPGTRPSPREPFARTHLLAFYGFLGLVVTTSSVGIGIYAFGYLTPWPLWHPVKILGNLSGAAVIVALLTFGYRRIADKIQAGKSTYSDWLFLDILLLTTLTGFLAQVTRLMGVRAIAYPTYFVHLLFVFFLLVYIPYSKFAHVVYRTVAMLHDAASRSGEGVESPTRSA